eukprot:1047484-Rhodomonas_salina.1
MAAIYGGSAAISGALSDPVGTGTAHFRLLRPHPPLDCHGRHFPRASGTKRERKRCVFGAVRS